MLSNVSETDRLFSHRDLWPWPIGVDDFESWVRVYRMSFEIFLDGEFLPVGQTILTDAALNIADKLMPELVKKPRWANYGTPEMGDMNVGMHTLRQAGTSAQALRMDAETCKLDLQERDTFLASAVLHDLGELYVGDITYDLKVADKKYLDIAESKAVLEMIDDFEDIDPQTKSMLKETHLRVTTSLVEKDIQDLLQVKSQFADTVKWTQLKDLFKLYERYGYLITAIQQYPLNVNGLSDEQLLSLTTWNRDELEIALAAGEDIHMTLRKSILFKNVILNQWPHIIKAIQNELPSSIYFFSGFLAERIIKHANDLMELDLDLSVFNEFY